MSAPTVAALLAVLAVLASLGVLDAGAGGAVARRRLRAARSAHGGHDSGPHAANGPGPARSWSWSSVLTPDRLLRAATRAGIPDPGTAVALWVLATAAAVPVTVVVPALRIPVLVGIAGPAIGTVAVGDRVGRHRQRLLPEALDAIAAGLRAGHALPTAIRGAATVGAPLDHELTGVADGIRDGRTTGDALGRWSQDRTDAATGLAVAALRVAAEVGGPGARAVDGAAASLRDRAAADAEGDALATQARISALVLTVAPIGFAVLLSGLDPRAGHFLLGTPAGMACIVAGVTLDGLGALWMSRLVRRSR